MSDAYDRAKKRLEYGQKMLNSRLNQTVPSEQRRVQDNIYRAGKTAFDQLEPIPTPPNRWDIGINKAVDWFDRNILNPEPSVGDRAAQRLARQRALKNRTASQVTPTVPATSMADLGKRELVDEYYDDLIDLDPNRAPYRAGSTVRPVPGTTQAVRPSVPPPSQRSIRNVQAAPTAPTAYPTTLVPRRGIEPTQRLSAYNIMDADKGLQGYGTEW